MKYADWNLLIAQHFFNPEKAGREVLLYVTDELLNQIGAPYGAGPDDFVHSIKSETASRDICKFALNLNQDWRTSGTEYPPYIGVLGLFVLSDVTEGDFVGHAYYPRLWARLGETELQGEPNQFDKMIGIWDDLEKWSRDDKGEELGRFVARIRGLRWKVGLARSQTLLSESERAELPHIFSEAGLEPGDPPNPEALLASVRRCRQVTLIGALYSRTIALLTDRGASQELRDALLAVLVEELEDWDGTLPGEEETPRVKQSLRIVVEELGGPFDGPLKARVRIWSRLPYPEDMLIFASGGRKWTCQEQVGGWSTPLEALDGQAPIFMSPDAQVWEGQAKLLDEGSRWGARQSSRDVRIFYRDQFEVPLPGWIESRKLEPGKPLLIAAGPGIADKMAEWGKVGCQDFKKVETAGMPSGWQLFLASKVLASHPDIPLLTLPKQLRIKLKGGIKPGRGNTYLAFAAPYIWVEAEAGDHEVQVLLDERRLAPIAGQSGVFNLPSGLQAGKAYKVKASTSKASAELLFRLVAPEISDLEHSCPGRKADGQIVKEGEPAAVTGGQAVSAATEPLQISGWPNLLREIPGSVLLGRHPGELWKAGEADFPGWVPIWAVLPRPHGRFEAVFCPDALDDGVKPSVGTRGPDTRLVAAWKGSLWNNRKLTDPPEQDAAKKLWEQYVQEARNV